MAPNADGFYRSLAGYLARKTDVCIEVVEDVPWQERERMLDRGEVYLATICGLPYVRKVDRADPDLELLAAPIMAAARYQERPVYFSDVIVRRDSRFRSLDDLRGASWAYNEPNSHSGHNLTRYHLARRGEHNGYFGRVVEAGSHQRAMRMVIVGHVDASAIDSMVLDLELRQHPALMASFRVIETFGPSPIPPTVISRRVPPAVRDRLREALLQMHEAAEGRRLLAQALLSRFTRVTDTDYDPIREMDRIAAPVRALGAERGESDRRSLP
jgi:phosphonate transport system substrate-binding protein